MNTIDNYLTVHTKHGFVFLPKRRKYRPKNREILAMIENPKEENRFYQKNNCVLKKLNDGNTIYLPPKIKRLSYFVLSGLLFFYYEKKPFSVTVGFVGRFDHFRHSALVFTKTVWVEPSRNNRLVANSRWYLKTSFEMDFLTGIVYALGIAFFDPIWIGLLQFNQSVKGKTVHQQADFKFIDVEENWRLFVFQHHCVQFDYSASELQNIIEHEKCTANKTTA
jgi:hypothetical protein